ncbi:conserved hypothetical protein [Coccidioides posadasii str. Silveira]|uniref:Uncharacterized protein n=2 Tax=Coccidioides posadasii TaxID=199306 RepID=E9DDC4_COCPS|nr:conserved hypothetical protein [Coccidioides posadasii str. Silveira]KMM65661.1 hypothetical protein CPAG_02007 [Coccidioides posadasii RMSCC 3488]
MSGLSTRIVKSCQELESVSVIAIVESAMMGVPTAYSPLTINSFAEFPLNRDSNIQVHPDDAKDNPKLVPMLQNHRDFLFGGLSKVHEGSKYSAWKRPEACKTKMGRTLFRTWIITLRQCGTRYCRSSSVVLLNMESSKVSKPNFREPDFISLAQK